MKKEYADHLEKLGAIRKQFESELAKVTAEQATVREELTNVLQVNKEQDNRIQILELQEQAAKLITNRNWIRALEYIAIGLDIAPNDALLLEQKGLCLIKVKKYSDATVVLKSYLSQYPDSSASPGVIANLAEAFLISKNLVEFDQLRSSYMTQLATFLDGAPLVFLDTLRALVSGETEVVRTILKSFAKPDLFPPQKRWMPDWDFSDANEVLAQISDESAKRYSCLESLSLLVRLASNNCWSNWDNPTKVILDVCQRKELK